MSYRTFDEMKDAAETEANRKVESDYGGRQPPEWVYPFALAAELEVRLSATVEERDALGSIVRSLLVGRCVEFRSNGQTYRGVAEANASDIYPFRADVNPFTAIGFDVSQIVNVL